MSLQISQIFTLEQVQVDPSDPLRAISCGYLRNCVEALLGNTSIEAAREFFWGNGWKSGINMHMFHSSTVPGLMIMCYGNNHTIPSPQSNNFGCSMVFITEV
jgi:hypothetical protein